MMSRSPWDSLMEKLDVPADCHGCSDERGRGEDMCGYCGKLLDLVASGSVWELQG